MKNSEKTNLIQSAMQKIITVFLISIISVNSFAQTQKNVSTCLLAQYNKTLYDRTKGNNPWGIGLGVQTFFNNKTKFTPTIELTGDMYLENDKVFRMNSDGTEINDIRGMINLFAGASFSPVQNIYFSFIAGPSLTGGHVLAGIKPSFGFYFSASHKWTGKVSYINIFNRDKTTKQDFGSLSFAVGIKLF